MAGPERPGGEAAESGFTEPNDRGAGTLRRSEAGPERPGGEAAESGFIGRVVAIYVAPDEGASMEARDEVQAIAGRGLEGDRYANEAGKYSGTKVGKRAVTLIEREAIEGARAEYALELAEQETRRNLVTEGVPVNHLVGKEFTVGGVRMRGYDLAEPCTYLEDLTRAGVRKALIHRGGVRAEILDDGPIRVGDPISLV